MKGWANLCLMIALAWAPGFGGAQEAKRLDALEIIRKSVAANAVDWKAQPEYSFREHDSKSKIDSSGQVKPEQSKSYDVKMIEGSPYYRLLAINNEALPRAQEQQEQNKLNREIKRRQHESPSERSARISKYQNERSDEHLLMQQLVAAFDFRLAGEEHLNGIDCYVFDASPNASYRPPVEKARVLKAMKGRLWIEKSEYHWAKVEAEVTQPVEFALFLARVKSGTKFELDQAPVGNVWLPKRFVQSINATVLGLYGMRSMEAEDYSEYHRATATGEIRADHR